MRYIEQAAVLLAACLLIGILALSRQDAPPVEAEAAATSPACADQDQQAFVAADQLNLTVRPAEKAKPLLRPAELLALPWQIQQQAGTATMASIEPAAATNGLPEHVILTLPWQIREQLRFQAANSVTGC